MTTVPLTRTQMFCLMAGCAPEGTPVSAWQSATVAALTRHGFMQRMFRSAIDPRAPFGTRVGILKTTAAGAERIGQGGKPKTGTEKIRNADLKTMVRQLREVLAEAKPVLPPDLYAKADVAMKASEVVR